MILLLNTSTAECQLTIVDSQNNQHDYSWQADRQLAQGLLAYLRDQLAKHQATFQDITAIGIFKGPGSFTGLRIGITVVNTLATELQIPIVGVSGEDWRQQAIKLLDSGQDDKIVMPDYGAPANITQPRK